MSDEIASVSWVEKQMGITSRAWIRANPPAYAWRSSIGDHDIIDRQGHRHTNAIWLTISLVEMPNYALDNLLDIVMPALPITEGASPEAASVELEAAWTVSLVDIDGQAFIRYERKFFRLNFEVQEIVIAERETRRPVRKDERQFELRGGSLVSEVIKDEYRYNEPAPKGTFEMPRWKPVKKFDLEKVAADVTDKLSESKRIEIERLIATSDNAWRDGSFEDFASVWHFSHVPYLRTADDWQADVEAQAGKWASWQSSVTNIREAKHVAIPQSGNSFHLIPLKTPGFDVSVTIRAVWLDGKIWEGSTRLTLASTNAGLRIIQWDVPIDEIKALKDKE